MLGLMSLRGARIRDFDVWGRLGQGGMSELWLAKQTVLLLPVVLKTLKADVARDLGAAGLARLLTEAQLMARITSPHVVRAIDAGMHDGTPFVAMEYVDGLDLAELDARRRASLGLGLPLWFVCHVMHRVCRALAAAHQTGVLHRDVKPSNVFGAAETGVRLGDFGIAIPRRDDAPKEISGTFRFMSPEQLRGDGLDRRADVYGAGATAFDLRYGTPPFTTVADALDAEKLPPFPPPEGPHEAYFQHVVSRMLQKARDLREHDLFSLTAHFRALDRALRPRHRVSFRAHGQGSFQVGRCRVEIAPGDLADSEADGIVNSAHDHMRMDGGCGLSLRARGGDEIEREAGLAGEQPLGACVPTSAGRLSARRVLHAVSAWSEISCVARAAHRTFLMADELGLRSLAIPALGTGASRVSIETSASSLCTTLLWHLMLGGTQLSSVKFVLRDQATCDRFREVAEGALRGERGPTDVPDLGLPADGEPTWHAATQLSTAR